MKICFATHNSNKVSEVKNILLNQNISILGLHEIGCNEELEETQSTIEGNSLQKAEYVHRKYGVSVFADDTGLEVEALNNQPGVYSARYAGEPPNFDANIDLLLKNLKNEKDRSARFKTVITLICNNEVTQFEGVVYGEILEQKIGNNGFGYDTVFMPKGYDVSFAQMDMELKNTISHRALAIKQFVNFLNDKYVF